MSQSAAVNTAAAKSDGGLGTAGLPLKHIVGEFKSFFTNLYGKMEDYEKTGSWPESRAVSKPGKKVPATNRKPRGKTPHNLFIREAIASAKARNEVPSGNNYLMMAQEKWRALSKEEQTAYATSKKDEIAQLNALAGADASELDGPASSPVEDDATETQAALTAVTQPATSPKALKTDKKRKPAEAVDQAEDGAEKKKKKKKKKSVVPAVET